MSFIVLSISSTLNVFTPILVAHVREEWRVKARSIFKSSRKGSMERWAVFGLGINNSGSDQGPWAVWVQPSDKPLGLPKEGIQWAPEEPPRATALVMSLPPLISPISLFLENRNWLWKDSLEMQSKRMWKKPGGKIGKNSYKSSGRTQAVLRTEMLFCFPEVEGKRQIEFCLPFSLKTTLWPWALVLCISN